MSRRRSQKERKPRGTRGNASGVAVFLLRTAPQLEVLLMKRAGGGMVGEWCPVAGHCEPGERPGETALREVQEETGLTLGRLGAPESEWSVRRGRGSLRIFVFSSWVEADAVVELNYEHTDFQWCAPERALDLLPLSQQRRALERVLQGDLP